MQMHAVKTVSFNDQKPGPTVSWTAASAPGRACVSTDSSRIIFRLSGTGTGTGTGGATLRIYLESFEPNVSKYHLDAQEALAAQIDIALQITELRKRTGRKKPTAVT